MMNQSRRGKLFISGGGNAEETSLLDFEFVKSLSNGKVLYIPIGLQKDYVGYDECYRWITKTLTQHSHTVAKSLEIVMWVNLERKRPSELEKFDAIYIGGARNSYSLMKEFRETKFLGVVHDFFNKGKNIYGGSAGALILGKDISVFGESIPDDYSDSAGLGLLNAYSVFCHYQKVSTKKLDVFLISGKGPVIALPERSGLIVQDNKAQVVGLEGAFIFKVGGLNNPQQIQPKQHFFI